MIKNYLVTGMIFLSHLALRSQSIQLEGTYTSTTSFNDLDVKAPYVYVVANGSGFDKGMEILNTTTLSSITKIGEFKNLTYADESAISIEVDKTNNIAYLGTNKRFYDISVSTPSSPNSLFSANVNGETQGQHLVGTKLYATRYNYGVAVTNVSNASSPSSLGTYNPFGDHGCEDIYVSGNYAYVTRKIYNKLWVLNMTNLASIQLTKEYTFSGGSANVYSVFVKDGYAYIAKGADGLIILDVSNPADPVEVSRYGATTSGYGYTGVEVVGDYAYVSGSQGLVVLNVSDPTDPLLEDEYAITGGAWKLRATNNYTYVIGGNSNEKLYVFSFSGTTGIKSSRQIMKAVISPNPAIGGENVRMKLPAEVKGDVSIRLTDAVLQGVLFQDRLNVNGENELNLDISHLHLNRGMYIVTIENGESTYYEKLVVQ